MCVRNEDRSPFAVHMKELQKVPCDFARKNPYVFDEARWSRPGRRSRIKAVDFFPVKWIVRSTLPLESRTRISPERKHAH